MKKAITGFVAGAILASASVAGASSIWRHDGITCVNTSHAVACGKSDGTGYDASISRTSFMVMNANTRRVVFVRLQP
jgi:Zn ribbon nucleic-acid-binding protein